MLAELLKGCDAVRDGQQVMLKLTIPTKPNLYAPLIAHPKVMRVVALSGGYERAEACRTPGRQFRHDPPASRGR